MYKVVYEGNQYYPSWEVELNYCEMVEIFFGFVSNPERGNECYDDAIAKAKLIKSRLPVTDY